MDLVFDMIVVNCGDRIKKKSESLDESIDDGFIEYGEEDDEISDRDERPESVDDKVRQKEMRKGIDLATTLERIEKNFVITDPRLPDNPIVRTNVLEKWKLFLLCFISIGLKTYCLLCPMFLDFCI